MLEWDLCICGIIWICAFCVCLKAVLLDLAQLIFSCGMAAPLRLAFSTALAVTAISYIYWKWHILIYFWIIHRAEENVIKYRSYMRRIQLSWTLLSLSMLEKKIQKTFMPPPFEEWWKGHIALPCPSVHPSPSSFGISNLCLSFSGGGIHVLWMHIFFTENKKFYSLL